MMGYAHALPFALTCIAATHASKVDLAFLGLHEVSDVGRASFTANRSVAAPLGQCMRNTGRVCVPWRPGTVINHDMQCSGMVDHLEECSAVDSADGLSGFCFCRVGECADGQGQCQREPTRVLPESFEISTQVFGTAQK